MKRAVRRFALAFAAAAGLCAPVVSAADATSAVAGTAIPEALRGVELRPLSLASADFDGDGIPDLAAGFADADGRGVVVLYRGNPDALYPHAPEARERLAQGRLVTSPFLSTDRALALPAPPDFLAAGDFDADGRMDLVAAARGSSLVDLHRGDGALGFGPPERLGVPGGLTALAAGDVGLRDGLADLIVATAGPEGARAVILQSTGGVRRAAPVVLALPEAAVEISTGAGERGNAVALRFASGAGARIERAERAWSLVDAREPADALPAAAREDDEAAALALRVDSRARGRVVLRRDGSLAAIVPAQSSTFVVDVSTDLADAAPGDGACADVNGDCSLRAAIQEANAHAGADVITFAIPGGGVPSIPVGFLPSVTEAVTIDGTTQSAGRVAVTGTSNGFLITLAADGCTVRGLVINGNGTTGLRVQSSDNVIEGNFVGTTPDGTATQGSLAVVGINLMTGSNNTVGGTVAAARNVIAGGSTAIRVDAGTGHVIEGNFIGTDVTGTVDLGGTSDGVRVFGGSATIGGSAAGAGNVVSGYAQAGVELNQPGSLVQGNRIGTDALGLTPIPNGIGINCNFNGDVTLGGTSPGSGNLVSGNTSDGISLGQNAPAEIVIQGNFVGTDAAGSFAIPNQGHGIRITGASETQIGGATAAARNVISGNLLDGIFITKFVTVSASANAIQGNFIGTDATGTVAIGNLRSGIEFEWAENNLIGGTGAGEGNVISGNFLHGIQLGLINNTVKNQVFGNRIGTNVFGTGPVGNRLSGVYQIGNSYGAIVGGTGAGQANTIAYNGGAGIASEGGRALHVVPNAIYDNGGLGLDLFDDGVTPNRGVGFSNNYPIVAVANDIGGGTNVSGSLSSKPATSFDVHIFSSLSCDPLGLGEGREYRKTVPVTTDAAGQGSFDVTITPPIPAGRYVTAYAVAPGLADDTSEFSPCHQLNGGPPPDQTPLALFAVTPGGGGKGTVTVQVAGEGFVPGATVRLERTGSPDIAGSDVLVSGNGTALTATFDLAAAALGAWDVTVGVPGDTATLPQAFTVSAATAPEIWADILGRGLLAVRAGQVQQFFLVFGNRGNTDAPETIFRVKIPWQLRVIDVAPAGESPRVVALDAPRTTGGSGQSDIWVYVPSVPASSSATVGFRLRTIAAQEGEFGEFVEAGVTWDSSGAYAPLFENAADNGVTSTVLPILDTPSHYEANVTFSKPPVNGSLHFGLTVQDSNFESKPVLSLSVSGGQTTFKFTVAFRNTPDDPFKIYSATLEGDPAIFALAGTFKGAVEARRKQSQDDMGVEGFIDAGLINESVADRLRQISAFATGLTAVLAAIRDSTSGAMARPRPITSAAIDFGPLEQIAHGAWTDAAYDEYRKNVNDWNQRLFQSADEAEARRVRSKDEFIKSIIDNLPPGGADRGFVRHIFHIFHAIDPNEKSGPSGTGDPAFYTDGGTPLPYTLTFENLETATAAAQEVVVTDQLDGSKLDLATFTLGPIAFGDHVVDVPPGRTSFTADVDLRPGIDLIARVTAGFDAATGLATWHFFSLDPATGLPTDDPILGFLPPNVATPEGEGHVSFTIRAKSGLPSGTQIHNMATIVFDANPPIDTADWFNTLDVTAPTSVVAALPGSSCDGIDVHWSGADANSGIASYDVYVSDDGGAFAPWLSETESASGTFFGTVGHTYGFFSVAHDRAGNVEAPPGTADASTTAGSPTPLTDQLTPTSGPAGGASVDLAGSGYAPGASVTVGTLPATSVVVHDPTSLSATFPALSPGALYDVLVQNPGGCASTFANAWLADFTDVPSNDIFHASVEKIARHGVTVGCGGGLYCIDRAVTRAEMAVFLIKGKYNLTLTPPPATGTRFGDVHPGDFAADYIEQLANEGITVGCANGNYCPDASITRAEMSVFLLKSEHGPLYTPPPATGTVFSDVHVGDFAADWIEQIALEGITAGCGGGKFCPNDPVSRGQMAAFLTLTFGF